MYSSGSLATITNIDSATQTFIITISSTKEEWKIVSESQNTYIRPLYDAQVHWMNYKTINPITEGRSQNVREIMIDGKEVSWRHIQGVYDYIIQNSTAKITRLTKRHDVENAMKAIDKLKEISAGTREFIHYAHLYRQIFHSKKSLEGFNDSRLQTLKNIHDWFVIRDKQKTSKINWISPQCLFDLLLSIQGFLGMVEEIFTLYPNSTIEPRRISQVMLEGLFGTIRQLGGDSSTQTLKGYGHALNKFQVTAKITSEIKSLNYGKSNHNGMEFDCLTRYDYRTKKSKNNNIHPTLLNHITRLSTMSVFTRRIFESLLLDDLFMGKIEPPTLSFSNEINQQNQKISSFQEKRQQLFNLCLYNDEIASLLEKWKNDIKNIASKLNPKKKGNLWMTAWIISQNHSIIQRLVAYFLVRKVIKETFKGDFYENRNVQEHLDPTLTSKKIIALNQAESQKFSYIIGWVLFKLLKRDHAINSHPKFRVMHALLETLYEERVEYVMETKSQTTNITPGPEFTRFMYYLKFLVIDLFEKHNELGPNILHYVKNSLISNLPLNQMFIAILKSSADVGLEDEEFRFIYERCITIYMRSRQKTWRDVNNYIPEKGTASLRESLKTMRSNHSAIENKKSSLMRKVNLPSNPVHDLEQLRVWAQFENVEDSFAKIFSVLELLWIIWAFGILTTYKRKQKLVPIIISNLKNSTPFTEEALKRRKIFMEQIE
ncbi:hypothetical protein RhiirA5_422676 [Rhizophagus irregularis]|uniref:Uncharacterized protein n=1 Tax=Rhizophagus irregularis TaxID=588596 RepID=A0A2N0PBD6_9GLOM|nr:hypothetical protein RhiirA5_422676 [Rhizophagus irregularis]